MNKLRWYINRLSLMSPNEICYRIQEKIKKVFEGNSDNCKKIDIPLSDINTQWYVDLDEREKVICFINENGLSNNEKARFLLGHKFSFFSFDKEYFGKDIAWHFDYKNHKRSSLNYSKDIDYRDFELVGDIKYIWELNRHQHLICLAKAFYLTGNEDYKKEVCDQVDSWIKTNPYLRGVNWTSSLELAIRLISWSWVWNFLRQIDDDFRKRWLVSIYQHCKFISEKFSKYSSANNHLIGEAAGLFIASIVWPFEVQSKRWQNKSYNILIDEIEKQNYEDGVNKEQAVSYQQFVLDFFILSGLLGERNGVHFPQRYWNLIGKMMEYIASIMDVRGNVPNIGDADDGYAVTLSDKNEFHPYRSLLATGAVLFKRGDLKAKAGFFDEKTFWLLGIEGYEQFNKLEEKRFVPKKSFEKGGYFVLGDSENTDDEIKLVFDCGQLGYLSIAAHGHADMLSFTLSVGGKRFLVDSGTYAYHTKKIWRDYFKGTNAHNTIRIDLQDQSVSGGNFMWIKKAEARLLKWESHDDYDLVIGNHDGYTRLKDPVIHEREIQVDKKRKSFVITDKIYAKKRHFIEQFFHVDRNCILKNENQHEWLIENKDKSIILKVDKKLQTNISSGSIDPICGWQSERFDVKEKIKVIVNSNEFEGNCEFRTLITINHKDKKNEN
ncbi:MAG: heparinase II/III family protein [Candidatus Brocadia sp.]|nr:heparinase II/III family protein [Candidatus Brocadia sp.]